MSFSKTTNKVLWCILLLWSLMIARNLVSSDLKGDEEAEMGLVSDIHEKLREVEALKLNYSSKTLFYLGLRSFNVIELNSFIIFDNIHSFNSNHNNM